MTRAHLGGTSAGSEPAGIKVYNAVGLEVAARRRLEGALGADFDLSPATFLNIDFRWNSSKTDIEEQGTKIATLRIHPSSFGAGIGFRF